MRAPWLQDFRLKLYAYVALGFPSRAALLAYQRLPDLSLPLLLLVSGLAWFLGLLTGGFLAVLVLSPSCRRLLVLALHSIIGLIAPAPGPGGQDLRIRLAGYRTHTA